MSTMPPFTQPSLVGETAGPARPDDPETSHEAAALPGRQILRLRVLRALLVYGDQTDEELAKVLGEEKRKASVGKRRQELCDAELAQVAKDAEGRIITRPTDLGGNARRWRLTMQGRVEAMALESEG